MDEKIYELYMKRNAIKIKLEQTDYKAIKFAEGELTTADYAPIREERRKYRAEINALETEIKRLRG